MRLGSSSTLVYLTLLQLDVGKAGHAFLSAQDICVRAVEAPPGDRWHYAAFFANSEIRAGGRQ